MVSSLYHVLDMNGPGVLHDLQQRELSMLGRWTPVLHFGQHHHDGAEKVVDSPRCGNFAVFFGESFVKEYQRVLPRWNIPVVSTSANTKRPVLLLRDRDPLQLVVPDVSAVCGLIDQLAVYIAVDLQVSCRNCFTPTYSEFLQ